MPKRFRVELERVGKTGTMFRVPFDLAEAFGRARPPVRVTIGGHTWRTIPGVYGGVGHIVVNRSVKAATGVDAPQRVEVVIELDIEPRRVRVPDDLARALAASPEAKGGFARLSSRTGASTSSGCRTLSAPRPASAASSKPSSACRLGVRPPLTPSRPGELRGHADPDRAVLQLPRCEQL